MDTINITFEVDFGIDGVDDDPKNALSRALASLAKNSLLPSLAQAFFVDETEKQTIPRWFGVFVKSAGERVIYFPGLNLDLVQVRGSQGKQLRFDNSFDFDHISLEKDQDSWHITTPASKRHQGGPVPTPLGEGRVLWFGMSIAGSSVLRPLKRRTAVSFQAAEKSSEWILEQLFKSRDGREFPMLFTPKNAELIQPPRFPYFSVIVGPPGFPLYQGDMLGLPHYSEYYSNGDRPDPTQLPTRHVQFRLDEYTDIQITTAWLPGRLSIPMLLASPVASESQKADQP